MGVETVGFNRLLFLTKHVLDGISNNAQNELDSVSVANIYQLVAGSYII